nr:MAG TPA: hypothetical protein [Caudoviricetes sp.]
MRTSLEAAEPMKLNKELKWQGSSSERSEQN